MSSKATGDVTSEQIQQTGSVPELRFPEFKGARAWLHKTLLDVCHRITNGKANAEDHEADGIYPLFDRSAVMKRSNEFIFDDEAVIVPGEGMRFQPRYFQGKFNLHQRAYVLMQHQGDAKFIFYTLDHFQDLIAQKALKSTVLSLRLPILEKFRIAVPCKNEQKKVADCLSSIDALIALEVDKLDAMNDHKKSLMQQLFPPPGETTPRLRFPQYRDTMPWVEKSLNQISPAIFDGTHQTPTYTDSGVPFFSVENIVSGKVNKFISGEDHKLATAKNVPEFGDVIITRIGVIGFSKVIDWEYNFSIYVTLAIIKKSSQFDPYYLHSFFQCQRYQEEIYRRSLLNAVPCKINMDELRKTTVLMPDIAEQRKIASLFSAIDSLLLEQSEKVGALRVHKKGLMQQLFPVANEMQR